MWSHGHFGLAALCAALPVYLAGRLIHPVAGVLILVFSLSVANFPDSVERTFGAAHRGMGHTVLFAVVVASILGVITWGVHAGSDALPWKPTTTTILVAGGSFVGICSHLLGDVITFGGEYRVKPWWPVKRRSYQLEWTTSSNQLWNKGFLVLGVAAQILSFLGVLV